MLEPLKRLATRLTHRIYSLPILILMPHSACNCRCVMCDIWKANHQKREISLQQLSAHLDSIRRLKVSWVVLSGGEALLHSNLWGFCSLLKTEGIWVTLLSSGLLVARHAEAIERHCDQLIVSLDGPPEAHDGIRRVETGALRLAEGVSALKRLRLDFPIIARSVIQRLNCGELTETVEYAREIGLDGISFLAADVSTPAFNHPVPLPASQSEAISLSAADLHRLAQAIEKLVKRHGALFECGFIANSPAQLWRIHAYYQALLGQRDFPTVRCNAPWVSAVVEADGTVRPCFFHAPLGNIHEAPLLDLLNARSSVKFRRQLNVARDPICRRCVCSLNLGLFQPARLQGRCGEAATDEPDRTRKKRE